MSRLIIWLAGGAVFAAAKTVEMLVLNRRDPDGAKRERVKRAKRSRLARLEKERRDFRDGDVQEKAYIYRVGRRGNEALAIRYGIANQLRKVREYTYYAKGGEPRRNPDRDTYYFEPANKITLRKVRKIRASVYLVELTDFGMRYAHAIIEPGSEVVEIFLPLNEELWFTEQSELELTLGGNGTFSLKELARFHVEKTVR